jgi:ceramide glucosyltransferase
MTLVESIPDAVSVVRYLGDICVVVAIVGCVFTLVACVCVLGFSNDQPAGPASQPPVTILKPLHDAEPDLPARLMAFCRQDYDAPVQVLCGVQEADSAVATMVNELRAGTSDTKPELVAERRTHGVNGKISNLMNMMPRARYDTLVLSDSDIVVGPGYLRAITALLTLPGVGAVTCLYYGIANGGWSSRLSALAVNNQFLPHAITGMSLGLARPCFGATVALRRSLLDRIGGFGALADVLADDHELGVAIRSQGDAIVTAPFAVGHGCFEASFLQLLRHQMRSARTIKSIEPLAYAGTIITHPLPLALLALLFGSPPAWLVVAAALLSRVLLCRCVEWRFALSQQSYRLIPLQDVIAFGIYIGSFFGTTVHWRGADYRVTADGTLLQGHDLRGS